MLRSLWQSLKDVIYDNTLGLFRSQEDIDIMVEGKLLEWGNVVYDAGDIPPEANYRKHEFWSYKDAISYVKRGGIPASCVTFHRESNGDEEGDERISVYVQEDTP